MKLKYFVFGIIASLLLCGCSTSSSPTSGTNSSSGGSSSSTNDHKHTITWKNYDGTILEIDNDVEEGTLPTYDGTTPKKLMMEHIHILLRVGPLMLLLLQ